MIRLSNAETDLLFVMQFGLMKKGKALLCVEHHSSRWAMMEGYDDQFILQKNIVKSNGDRAVKARNYQLITGRKPKLMDWSYSNVFVDGITGI